MSKPKTSVAMVRSKNHNGASVVEVISVTEDSHGRNRINERVVLPKYDMATINPSRPRYHIEDFDEDLYREILISKEGIKVLNVLKNEKTDKIVNDYVQLEKSKCSKHDKVKHNFTEICDEITSLKLTDKNLLSHKVLGLHKEEIWTRFKKSGLVDKFKSAKK